MTFHHTSQTGFSLVEVLVAISILLLFIIGPMKILTNANNGTAFATEQVTAWFLAQEGLELAQKYRDDLVLQSFRVSAPINNPWTLFLGAPFSTANCFNAAIGCGLSIGSTASASIVPVNCATAGACKLYLSPSTTIRSDYIHTVTSNLTPFTRVITMQPSMVGGKVRSVRVTSTVTWRTGSLIAGQRVEAVTYLFNVYDSD